jgi:hypothetical protein
MKLTLFGAVLIGAGVAALGGFENGDGIPAPPEQARKARDDAFARARIFREEVFDATAVDFAADPNSGAVDPNQTICKYQPDEVTGTTPKFECVLANGEKVKVKYGWTKEIPSEIAATRLLHALGFGADRVSRVASVRCYGCPFEPFYTRSLAEILGLTTFFDKRIDYTSFRDFHQVGVERNLDGEPIEVGKERGWSFHELKAIKPARGGATRGEVDAMRLMAVFLHHWDNKTSNQRLICESLDSDDCEHPLAMIQDAGSAFGPKKADLHNWRSRPVWADHARCVVSMKDLPYNGGTFDDVAISENGRRLLGERLRQLSADQISALFTAAGLEHVPEWVASFQDKVRQIVARPSCPSLSKKELS